MNDLKNLLETALDGGPARDIEIDPAADLDRGRSRLRQRRIVTLSGVAATALAVLAIPLALNGTGSLAGQDQTESLGPATSAAVKPATRSQALPALELVAYQGKQVPGYRVASTPKGWEIQGGDPFALVIASKGAKDRSINSYAGKLVVMLQSKDASAPTAGTVQEVDGRPGRLDVQGDTQILTYQTADKRWMVIQAPTVLGWTGTELARFASGVEVLTNAEAGVG